MVRYDLAFFLCCCKSFLGSDSENGEDFYSLLKVDRDATQDELKRAYKRQSLQMHPDKLAQRGIAPTEAHQAKFTRMKEAYEVLSDPHKRETYDAIGERGMKWLDEPFSLDPQELAHNFATSSVLDRSKIFAIFVSLAVAVFWLPIMVCLHVDDVLKATWAGTLLPLWIWDAFIFFYHSRVIMMGPIPRPDHISPEDWVDPLPMSKRIFSLARFGLLVLFQVLMVLRLDGVVSSWPWAVVFGPLYIWEFTTLWKKWPLARMRIVTVEDLETALGKPFSEFTVAEKELIGQRYSVVPSTTSPEFEAAQKLKVRARHDMIKSGFRIVFCVLLLCQLDGRVDWNWWFIFTPFWVMTLLFCYANYQAFAEVQQMAMEKDPTLFGNIPPNQQQQQVGAFPTGKDGQPISPLTEEEREELKAHVMASSSRLCSKCCSQGFLLMIVLLFVGKVQGAGYSSFWILSPLLTMAGMILCCIGFAIFGITEVPTDGVEFDTGEDTDVESPSAASYVPPAEAAAATPTAPPTTTATSVPPTPVDLLDNPPQPQTTTTTSKPSGGGSYDLD
uniref:J domain-containing protein n=1 Tax=Grammatophora oceanica TaxID=210454 RepID=A0A7S1UVB4_9STRA|mmetsp:Transcript_21234/g.31527  ORF Transcript_21234/g.31527 Transcript_21234/m.31527 type:complete len:558 (+) Transcript_21234:355-2028(+)|eukprot:CAMPEP_0194039086 /NCGR_PEP_ID=MMETSP0009_2-20130614/11272_1 /TAXON_ID=210454 /ORGANISM="Grammatophora oceanica, Strain CCMP 410" /LENGTH=557 /DNA_ID=CAMNT_0038681817 /DNA_START=335 /DNA_END=2008 /DNA_ORIENTATION=+